MTDYKLQLYQKGIEEAQSSLGREVTEKWEDFHQSSAEYLQNVYSRPDFDPETRLYAFKDDELVGFMVSRVVPESEKEERRIANLDFPFVKKGHEEVSKILYEKAIKTLKRKGVKLVQARVGKNWHGTVEQAEKLGYKKKNIMFLRMMTEVTRIQLENIEERFNEFDPEQDEEQLIQFYKDHFNMSDEQARTNFEGIIKSEDGLYFQPVFKEGDKIISRGLLFIPKDSHNASFRPLVPDPTKYFEEYLAYITKIAKEKEIEKFQLTLGGAQLDHLEHYKLYGFEVTNKIFYYEKEI